MEKENSLVQVSSDSENYTEKNDIDAGSFGWNLTFKYNSCCYLIECFLEPNIGIFNLISHLIYL